VAVCGVVGGDAIDGFVAIAAEERRGALGWCVVDDFARVSVGCCRRGDGFWFFAAEERHFGVLAIKIIGSNEVRVAKLSF